MTAAGTPSATRAPPTLASSTCRPVMRRSSKKPWPLSDPSPSPSTPDSLPSSSTLFTVCTTSPAATALDHGAYSLSLRCLGRDWRGVLARQELVESRTGATKATSAWPATRSTSVALPRPLPTHYRLETKCSHQQPTQSALRTNIWTQRIGCAIASKSKDQSAKICPIFKAHFIYANFKRITDQQQKIHVKENAQKLALLRCSHLKQV